MPTAHEAIEAEFREYELTESTAHCPQPNRSHPIDVRPENWQEVRLFTKHNQWSALRPISYVAKQRPKDCIMQWRPRDNRRPE